MPATQKPKPTKSFIPPQQQPNSNFVPNLAAAGLRTTPSPRPAARPTARPQQFPKFTQFQQQQPRQQQQQPRQPVQQFGRPSTQQPPRTQFTQGQTSIFGNQGQTTQTQLSGPRQTQVRALK